LQDAINLFIKDVYSLHQYYTVYKPKAASWSNCAKKGIKLYADFMTKLKAKADQIVADTTAKGGTVKTIKDSPLGFWFRSQTTGVPDKDEMRNNPSTSFVEYPQITLQAFVAPTNTTQNLVFTPNTDGKNDLFEAYGTNITSANIAVFNRWGMKVFESSVMPFSWNGKKMNSGEDLPQGIYVYTVKLTDKTGHSHSYNGTVALIR